MITAVLRTVAPSWPMIPTLTANRCPDDTIASQAAMDREQEDDFSKDQDLIIPNPD
jgi:hypothetical protein